MEQRPSGECNRFSASQEKTFYGTWRFITAFTSPCLLSLFWARTRAVQSVPPLPTSWSFTLILSTKLCIGLPNGHLPSGVPTKTLYAPLLSPIHATCPTHFVLLDLITQSILGEEYSSLSSSLCSLLHSPVTSSLLGPDIFLSTLFSNTFSLHCSHTKQQAKL